MWSKRVRVKEENCLGFAEVRSWFCRFQLHSQLLNRRLLIQNPKGQQEMGRYKSKRFSFCDVCDDVDDGLRSNRHHSLPRCRAFRYGEEDRHY